ncbi:MAG: hypothetical protein AB8E15_09385 [Bdellovibrionales bacterium]
MNLRSIAINVTFLTSLTLLLACHARLATLEDQTPLEIEIASSQALSSELIEFDACIDSVVLGQGDGRNRVDLYSFKVKTAVDLASLDGGFKMKGISALAGTFDYVKLKFANSCGSGNSIQFVNSKALEFESAESFDVMLRGVVRVADKRKLEKPYFESFTKSCGEEVTRTKPGLIGEDRREAVDTCYSSKVKNFKLPASNLFFDWNAMLSTIVNAGPNQNVVKMLDKKVLGKLRRRTGSNQKQVVQATDVEARN